MEAAAAHATADDLVGTLGVDERCEYLGITLPFLKARPAQDGARRYVYCEASNEAWDQENERVAQDALRDSVDLFLAKGNLDIEHKSILGHLAGAENPREWEIGVPLAVKFDGGHTFVKGELYRKHPKADWFWSTLTVQDPPMRWFPSVGGQPLVRVIKKDPHTGAQRAIITKAKWINLAFAREPQNLSVPGVSLMPVGAFAKALAFAAGTRCCLGPDCAPGTSCKAITAGYGTDSATLTGGGALRRQSLQGGVIHQERPGHDVLRWEHPFAKHIAALDTDRCPHSRGIQTPARLFDHFSSCEGMGAAEAAAATTQLLARKAAYCARHEAARREAA